MLFLKEYWSDQNFTRIILHDEGLEELSIAIHIKMNFKRVLLKSNHPWEHKRQKREIK